MKSPTVAILSPPAPDRTSGDPGSHSLCRYSTTPDQRRSVGSRHWSSAANPPIRRAMMQMRTRGFSILSLVLITFLPAGSVDAAPRRPADGGRTAHAGHAGHVGYAGHTDPGAGAPADAPELVLRLQAVLGQHSILAADFMRGRISG